MQTRWLVVAIVTAAAPVAARPTLVASITEEPAPGEIDARAPIAVDPPPPPMSREFAAIHIAPPEDPRVRIEHTAATVREVRGFEIVTMTVTASSTEDLWHDTDLVVSVPRAARVVGLALEESGQLHGATLVDAPTARQHYDDSVRIAISLDPALLELEAHGKDYDRLRLSLYPISSEQVATAKLTVIVPRVDRLVVDVIGQRNEFRAGTPDIATVSDRAFLAAAAVNTNRSLYVPAPTDPAAMIRNLMHASRAALRGCEFPHGSVAHFTIATDGHVRLREIRNGTELAVACMARQVERWRVPTRATPVGVSYQVGR
jgi:hypothetical protein